MRKVLFLIAGLGLLAAGCDGFRQGPQKLAKEYLGLLQAREFPKAYGLLCEGSKKNISQAEYISYQQSAKQDYAGGALTLLSSDTAHTVIGYGAGRELELGNGVNGYCVAHIAALTETAKVLTLQNKLLDAYELYKKAADIQPWNRSVARALVNTHVVAAADMPAGPAADQLKMLVVVEAGELVKKYGELWDYYSLGAAQEDWGACEDAVNTFTKAVAMPGSDVLKAECYYFRAKCYLKMKDLKSGKADLAAAAALDPQNPRVKELRARLGR